MTKNLDSSGLKSVADQFDLFFIDLWGVIHNGIELYEESVDVLEKLTKTKKEFVLLTNAPRPNINVVDFLSRMGTGISCPMRAIVRSILVLGVLLDRKSVV